ncbi:12166_t:CDS:10 [Ambispora leptoticha]|uniref:12166_t:CDS:1 n=1 Tax=Ambispora leptoticha TaxID=144679 RepID=A0A9N8Z1W5_9GLOM|nr:12166_t:CDS:10 [Ambispora leptoticha]
MDSVQFDARSNGNETASGSSTFLDATKDVQADDTDYALTELKLDKGENIKCFIRGEPAPDLHEKDLLARPGCGLSSEQALEKLIGAANRILSEHQEQLPKINYTREFLTRPDSLLTIFSFLLLIAFFVYGTLNSSPYQFRLNSILVEAVLIFAALIWNSILYAREMRLTSTEISVRAKNILEQLKKSVVRDGFLRDFPTSLLVEGDTIEMMYGDSAPCTMKYVGSPFDNGSSSLDPSSEYIIEANQVFNPSLFGSFSDAVLEHHIKIRGRYQFISLQTPWVDSLRDALKQKRPATVIRKQAEVLEKFFLRKVISLVLVAVIVVNLLRYIIKDILGNNGNVKQGFELFTLLPVYAILPILPISFPTLWLIIRCFGNATILVLSEALQTSKTEYEDDEEVDEFDAGAPPPTKNIHLNGAVVLNKFLYLLTKWDQASLTRSTNLFESLGGTTVICSIDREGTISSPFPSVEHILFPRHGGETTFLDVSENPNRHFSVQFEDQDWEQYLSCLKPVGLNLLLNTNCGVLQGKKHNDQHRKYSSINIHAKTKPARQACLCRLGKEIGFTNDALQAFVRRKEIYTFAPCHPSLKGHIRNDQWEVPSMVSSIYEETGLGTYQLLSDGHVEIILDNCSDYWDGESLQPMTEGLEKKIYDFYENAIINDMQCIAYAYRPINVENKIPFLNYNCVNDPAAATHIVLPPTSDEKAPDDSYLTEHDITLSQWIRYKRLKAGQLEGLHDFIFEEGREFPQDQIEKFYRDVTKGQIFLSMVTLCHQPKVDVCNFIEDLSGAGIRFVYFSPTAERESKAYAERLGLETDWNSCILLSSPGDLNSSYRQMHDIKARLPVGIQNIRNHLEEVDDIPLHVSLFAECTPDSTYEMIKIFQEYGEVVCCLGSALKSSNARIFALADVGIAMEPTHTQAQTHNGLCCLQGDKGQLPLALGASLTTLPCGLFMRYDTSLYALADLIREARRLTNCLRMGAAFMIGSYLSITTLLFLSCVLFLPPIFTGYQILWVLWVISPLLAFSFFFNPHEADTMTTMPVKNVDHLSDLARFIAYFFLRFSLPMIMCLTVFILSLSYFDDNGAGSFIFGSFGNEVWLNWSKKQQWEVLYAQNCALFIFVWYLACLSPTFLHRTLSLRDFVPYHNHVWYNITNNLHINFHIHWATSIGIHAFAWSTAIILVSNLIAVADNFRTGARGGWQQVTEILRRDSGVTQHVFDKAPAQHKLSMAKQSQATTKHRGMLSDLSQYLHKPAGGQAKPRDIVGSQ